MLRFARGSRWLFSVGRWRNGRWTGPVGPVIRLSTLKQLLRKARGGLLAEGFSPGLPVCAGKTFMPACRDSQARVSEALLCFTHE